MCVGYYKMNLSVHFVKTLKDTLIIIIVIIIIIAVEVSLVGSSPYTSTDKTNKNKYT